MSLPPCLSEASVGCLLQILVQPRSSRTRVVGIHDGRLKLAVAAPPVDGEANREVLKFLSKKLGIPRSSLELRQGETGRRKALLINNLTPAETAEKLGI